MNALLLIDLYHDHYAPARLITAAAPYQVPLRDRIQAARRIASQIERPTPASLLPAMNQPITDRQAPATELERLLVEFLEWTRAPERRRGGSTSRSRDGLRTGTTRWLRLSGVKTVAELSAEAVRSAYVRMADNLAPETVKGYSILFRRFLRWLVDQGHTSAQPALEVIDGVLARRGAA